MSKLIVKLQRITQINPHSNADRLEIAWIGAWQTCVKKDTFAVGDLVVFIPPDAILPRELHEHLGITNYCGSLPKNSEEAQQGKMRVRAARLRGVRSFGTLMKTDDVYDYLRYDCLNDENGTTLVEGDDVSELLGITKYEPPEKVVGGDMAPNHILFHKYTDIERYQNFPYVLAEGEEVVITEKIHGTNCRIGIVQTDEGLVRACGSHKTNRKMLDSKGNMSLYWKPLDDNGMCGDLRGMTNDLQKDKNALAVIVFGEIYGPGIQDMHYGGKLAFRVFDIAINGEYMNWDDVEHICGIYGVETVPVLFRGPFDPAVLYQHTDGPTHACESVVTKFKGREGCVVKPIIERKSLDIPSVRVILKSVSADYLGRSGAKDNA
jgi:RNA ligase (TIGR02306 family)